MHLALSSEDTSVGLKLRENSPILNPRVLGCSALPSTPQEGSCMSGRQVWPWKPSLSQTAILSLCSVKGLAAPSGLQRPSARAHAPFSAGHGSGAGWVSGLQAKPVSGHCHMIQARLTQPTKPPAMADFKVGGSHDTSGDRKSLSLSLF